jgi:hypothetical protein
MGKPHAGAAIMLSARYRTSLHCKRIRSRRWRRTEWPRCSNRTRRSVIVRFGTPVAWPVADRCPQLPPTPSGVAALSATPPNRTHARPRPRRPRLARRPRKILVAAGRSRAASQRALGPHDHHPAVAVAAVGYGCWSFTRHRAQTQGRTPRGPCPGLEEPGTAAHRAGHDYRCDED